MNITLEQIDELRVRANVGYKEAKEALTKTDGSMVEALIYLEETYGVKTAKKSFHEEVKSTKRNFEKSEAASKCKSGFKRFMSKKFRVSNDEKVFLDIPLFLTVLFVLASEGFGLIVLGIGYMMGLKYKVYENEISKTATREETPSETTEEKSGVDLGK